MVYGVPIYRNCIEFFLGPMGQYGVWYGHNTVLYGNGDEYGRSLCPEITKVDSFTSLKHQ